MSSSAASSSGVKIAFNSHGTGRVRVVKVNRQKDGTHSVQQLNVQLLLEGDAMDQSFYTGDNSIVVPTDTCKNTVYCLAKLHDFASIEDFGLIICKHFLQEYPKLVNRISVEIIADNWERITTSKDSNGRVAPHKHAFKRVGPKKAYTHVQGTKRAGTKASFSVQSGVTNLEIMKTTQSGFSDFHKCKYTSLPETTDRLVGTSVSSKWEFNTKALERGGLNFNRINANIETNLVNTFSGPSDTGTWSPSVQLTLYEMGRAAVEGETSIDRITLEMPNIHNIVFPLENYGISNKDHVGKPSIYFPIDEPHGMIKAVVERTPSNMRSRL